MKKKIKRAFSLPTNVEEAVRSLTGVALEEFVGACFDYNKGEDVTINDPFAKTFFSLVKDWFDRELDICKKRKECGAKGASFGVLGGRRKVTETPKEPQKNPKETPKEPQNDVCTSHNTNNQHISETPNGVTGNIGNEVTLEIEAEEIVKTQDIKEIQEPTDSVDVDNSKMKEEKNENEEKESLPHTPMKGKEEKDKKEESRTHNSVGARTRRKPDNYSREFLHFCTEDMYPIFKDWLVYKRQIGKTYKSPMSIEMAYNKLIKFSKGLPDIARIIIDDAIANNYQGFFPLKESLKRAYIDPATHPEEFWERVIEKFNTLGIVPISKETLDDERKVAFINIVNKYGVQMVAKVYGKIKASDRMHGVNSSQWMADFDFVFTDKNFKRIYDGSFDNPKNV